MSDDRDPRAKSRIMSDTERANIGAARRRSAVGIPAFVQEELTGNYSGPELAERRAARPTDKRFEKLETFKDTTTAEIGAIKMSIVKIESDGKLTAAGIASIEKMLTEERLERQHRERLELEQEHKVETAERVADVEVRKSKTIDTNKARIERVTKIVGAVIGLLSSGAVLHWILGKL
jgi:hypothetical protein